jgi:predicted O-methyltransferase YrrM
MITFNPKGIAAEICGRLGFDPATTQSVTIKLSKGKAEVEVVRWLFNTDGHLIGESLKLYRLEEIAGGNEQVNPPPLKLRPQSKYQDSAELEWFVRLTQKLNVQRYLEIGSRWGDSLYAVMMNRTGQSPVKAFAGVIDISESPEKHKRLVETLDEIEKTGVTVAHFSGSSRNPAALVFAQEQAPYDLIFIDGDHTYEGAMADWYTYHQHAPVIVFHDIAAPDTWVSDGKLNGVQKFWRELTAKDTCSHGFKKVEEFVTPGSNMGYGVIYR